MKSYNQIFIQSNNSVPKSRSEIMRFYCKKYLPSLTARIGGYLEAFIDGDISYHQMLYIIYGCDMDMQLKIDNILSGFDTGDMSIYGVHSMMSRRPVKIPHNPIPKERRLFMEAFGPGIFADVSHVRGTVGDMKNRIASIGAW